MTVVVTLWFYDVEYFVMREKVANFDSTVVPFRLFRDFSPRLHAEHMSMGVHYFHRPMQALAFSATLKRLDEWEAA